MLKLARQYPPIANASDALTILRGSWIEVIVGNDLRLSPLINDIGSDLGEDEVIRCRQTAAELWLGAGTLDQRTLLARNLCCLVTSPEDCSFCRRAK